ncbi:MAG: hypothetical protein QW521_02740 [Desulfurococcaceae archaeon]
MKVKVRIGIKHEDLGLLKAIHESLIPESKSLPSNECSLRHRLHGDLLEIEFDCSRVNILRALLNSYLGVLSSVMEYVEEAWNVDRESTSRSEAEGS